MIHLLGSPERPFRIGTRGSRLALAQAALVEAALMAHHPGLTVETVVIRTEGDVDKTSPLTVIGGRGVFTSALGEALAWNEIDAAVHSAKDLPSEPVSGLTLAAFLKREDPRDVVVSRHGLPLADLPPHPTVGTSSRRRAVQVRLLRPDAHIVELRGNIDTRLRKAVETEVDAIVLAAAGVARMGWQEKITEYLSLDQMVPSPGQGALAIEIRSADPATAALVQAIDDPLVSTAVRAERAFLRAIGGGCTTPVGAYAHPESDGRLHIRAFLASEDGERIERTERVIPPTDAEATMGTLARRMLVAIGGTLDQPLAGLTVLVTRAQHQAADLNAALRARGAEPLELPTIAITAATDPAPLAAAVANLAANTYDWVVFTSGNAVDRMLTAVGDHPATHFGHAQLAAVGEATAARLRAAGLSVALVPPSFTAEDVLAAMVARGVAEQRILFPRGTLARETIATGLRAAGAIVDEVEVYRTEMATEIDPAVRARIARGDVDVVTFASPSSARNLVAMLNGEFVNLRRATVACVGPMTAEVAARHGLPPDVVATESTVNGLVDAIVDYYRDSRAAAIIAAPDTLDRSVAR